MWQWQPHVCVRAMARHPQLFVFISLLVVTFITRYGNSTFNGKPIVLPPMPPRKFFPFDSPVHEFPFGSIGPLLDFTRDEEIVFVMYYAPWCTRSMAVRWEFHKAAKFMQNRVKFVAINCWWYEGECRRKYKFMSHPMLYVYHTTLDGFQYTGVPTAEHFVKFLEDILYPITPLFDERDVRKFVSLHDNVVIGYFDFNSSPQPPGYLQFYYASMRAVERNPFQVLKFGVVTAPHLTNILTMPPKSGSAVLVKHGNIVLKYSPTKNFTSSDLVKWAFDVSHQPLVKILSPSGSKSLHLSSEITKGATVIMFSVHSPLFDVNQYYHMLREVALEYNKCERDEAINESLFYSLTHRLSSMKKMQETIDKCQHYWAQEASSNVSRQQEQEKHQRQQHFTSSTLPQYSQQYSAHPQQVQHAHLASISTTSSHTSSSLLACQCCVSVLQQHLLQGHLYRNVCEVCYNKGLSEDNGCRMPHICPKGSAYELSDDRIYGALQNKCLEFSPNYMPTEYKSVCCREIHISSPLPLSSPPSPSSASSFYPASSNAPPLPITSNKVPSSNAIPVRKANPFDRSWESSTLDPYVEGVLKNRTQHLCDRLNLQLVQGVPVDTNLSILTFEPIRIDNFTGLSCRTNRTVLFYTMDVINHWVFAERLGLNATELVQTKQPAVVIIDDEDEKSYVLKKTFSKTSVAEFIQNYTENILQRQMLSMSPTSSSSIVNCSWKGEDDEQGLYDLPPTASAKQLCITEVTSCTFHQVVLNTSKDVLLLYYTPWCGFCSSFAHIYLSLAKYFRAATSLIFARINGDTEDLPWEYTADTYPTLLFFPSGRKEDSVVYSEDLPKTLPNLIRFVLHHATQTVSLRTDSTQQCTARCIKTNLQNAFNRISILDKQLKRLELRLNRLESSVLRTNLLNIPVKKPSQQLVGVSLAMLRVHWQKQVDRKRRQRLVCKKLIRFLRRKNNRSLSKEDLVKFMKANNLLMNSLPSH